MKSAQLHAVADRRELRAEVRERSVTPKELIAQLKTGQPLEGALLVVERTRWMAACLLALLVATISLVAYINANKQLQNNKELIYVRMHENGTWDVDFPEATRAVEFLPATIDSLISQFVIRRFQEIPYTIRYDYGFAQLFLDYKSAKAFLDPTQGNAVQRAAAIKDCTKCTEKHIEVRTIDHSSSERTEFGKVPGQLYRTTVFIREVSKDERGQIVGTPQMKIVPIHWRLMSKKEIEATVKEKDGTTWLRNNPIGLQILDYQLLDDPSDTNSTTAKKG